MRRTTIITTALAATAALAVGPVGGASAKKATQLDCGLKLFAQGQPNPSGIQFGFVTCQEPFGNGVHYDEYTVTPTSPGHGTIAATFTNSYDLGTTSGTAALTFTATGETSVAYSGTVTYTHGTGKFKQIAGGGTIECTSVDRGAHKSCTVHSTLTGV